MDQGDCVVVKLEASGVFVEAIDPSDPHGPHHVWDSFRVMPLRKVKGIVWPWSSSPVKLRSWQLVVLSMFPMIIVMENTPGVYSVCPVEQIVELNQFHISKESNQDGGIGSFQFELSFFPL